MAYLAKIGNETLEIGRKEFLAANDRLSVQWHQESDPGRRREIVRVLFDLDLRLFRAWRVFGNDNRADYEQEAFLWLTRALETFKPGKGAFVAWLKFYILKAQEEVSQAGRRTAANAPAPSDEIEAPTEEGPDHQFWCQVRSKCTDEEWILLSARLLEGLSAVDAAAKADMHPDRAKKLYSAILQRVRIDIASRHLHDATKNISGNSPVFTDEPIWVQKNWLRKRLDLTAENLKDLLNQDRPIEVTPWFIDPLDVAPIMGGRIRYWETRDRGLVHPKFLRKKRA